MILSEQRKARHLYRLEVARLLRKRAIRMWQSNPDASVEELGEQSGILPQTFRSYLVREGLDPQEIDARHRHLRGAAPLVDIGEVADDGSPTRRTIAEYDHQPWLYERRKFPRQRPRQPIYTRASGMPVLGEQMTQPFKLHVGLCWMAANGDEWMGLEQWSDATRRAA